jgi:hypothetical protein
MPEVIPLHFLSSPSDIELRTNNLAVLYEREAVSVLPAVASLKALRHVARRDPDARPW